MTKKVPVSTISGAQLNLLIIILFTVFFISVSILQAEPPLFMWYLNILCWFPSFSVKLSWKLTCKAYSKWLI